MYCIKELISEKISGEWGSEPDESSSVKVLRTTNFTNSGVINFEKVVQRNISKLVVDKKRLQLGDVIIEKSGGSPTQPVGRVVYFDKDVEEPILCNNFTTILRPNEKVFPKYFFYSLYANHLTGKTLKFQNKTTGIINLKLERYLDEKIPLPPLSEQKRIADILDKADSLRQKRKESIALLDELLKSVFIDMFGDLVRNEKGWEVRRLGEVTESSNHAIKAGPFGSLLKKEFYVNDGYKIYGQEQVIRNDFKYGDYYISEDRFKTLKQYEVKSNDVLISLVGTFGHISIVPDEFKRGIINPRLVKISLDRRKTLPEFFKCLLTTERMRKYLLSHSHGGTMGIINLRILKSLKLILPPIGVQREFVDILKKSQIMRERMALSNAQLEFQFNALLQRAFRGEANDKK